MNKDRVALVSYASGYFDGEGCIYTRHQNTIQVSLAIDCRNSKASLGILKGLFGGNIGVRYSNRDKKCFYYWRLQDSLKIKKALKIMLPFLRLKKKEAELGVRLCERVIVAKKTHGRAFLSDHENELRQSLADELKRLKRCLPLEITQKEKERVETKRMNVDKNQRCDSPILAKINAKS